MGRLFSGLEGTQRGNKVEVGKDSALELWVMNVRYLLDGGGWGRHLGGRSGAQGTPPWEVQIWESAYEEVRETEEQNPGNGGI